MDRKETNRIIVNYLGRYNPERIGLFGSYARQDDSAESDIDILIKFRDTISLFDLARIYRELPALIGRKIDIITEPSLKNETLKNNILRDLQIIYK